MSRLSVAAALHSDVVQHLSIPNNIIIVCPRAPPQRQNSPAQSVSVVIVRHGGARNAASPESLKTEGSSILLHDPSAKSVLAFSWRRAPVITPASNCGHFEY